MRFSAEQDIHDGSAEADESFVRKEIERIRGFVGNLSMGDPRQGMAAMKQNRIFDGFRALFRI